MTVPPRFGLTLDDVLGDIWVPGATTVCIPDATRPLAVAPVLRALAPHLALPPKVVVGLGLHRRMTETERAPLIPWSPIEHDPDNTVATIHVDGIPGSVARAVVDADQTIGIGVVELHQYAGVSGGHKAVAVGCGGRATLAALHARERVLATGVRVGQVAGNPFRAAIDRLGEAAGCRAALVWIPDLSLWGFGEPRALIEQAAARIQPFVPCARRYADAILHVPAAKGRTLYQASRAATYLALSPEPPLLPGATLRIHAPLREGLGEEAGFVAALRGSTPPWSTFLHGPEPRGAGAQRAVMLALLAQSYKLEVWGCENPKPLLEVGIFATTEQPTASPDTLLVAQPFQQIPQWVQANREG